MYHTEPATDVTQANDTIKYNKGTQQWKCQKCEQTANAENKRNFIQHAVAKHKTPRTHTTRTQTLTPEEHKIAQIRIKH